MKFTIDANTLNTELSAVLKTVPKKATIPVLETVLVRAEPGLVTIYGTDLDNWLIATVPALVDVQGAWALPGDKFLKVVKSVLGQQLEVEVDDNKVRFTAGKTKMTLPVTNEEQYPEQPVFIKPKEATVGSGRFCDMIRDVLFASTKDISKFTIDGAKLEITDKHIRLIATDAHRLSFADSNGVSGDLVFDEKSVILRSSTLKLMPMIGAVSETIKIEADMGQHTAFTAGNRVLIGHNNPGNFPNYDMVLPKDNDIVVSFDQVKLKDVIKRAAPFVNTRTRLTSLSLDKNKLTVSAKDGEDGEWSEDMDVDVTNPKELTVSFDLKYIQEYLNTIKSGRGVMELRNAYDAVEFTPVDYDYELRYVVMPRRS